MYNANFVVASASAADVAVVSLDSYKLWWV